MSQPQAVMASAVPDNAGQHDNLSRVQRRRKQFAVGSGVLLLFVLLFTQSVWLPDTMVHEGFEWAGYALILACILGRTWCSLYIGGRKKQILVQQGPYSMSRNPLYLFSVLGGAGVGFQAGSLITGLVLGLFVFALFSVVIAQEEAFLRDRFPAEFNAYAAAVPRWGPRFSAWRDAPEVMIHPRLVLVTFRDALWFLLAIPLLEGIELLQEAGWLPVLLHLP
ncbi:MAG: methyltransferase family protein [Ferrovibrio sp.]